MRIDILTLFPDMCEVVFNESIIGRALRRGALEIRARDIRYFTHDKHNRVDDAPYGGGTGMLMQAQPIYDCYVSLCDELGTVPHCIYMSPQGKRLDQQRVKELSQLDNIAILCGHYEGVDERVLDCVVDEEISIGDFVVTGGELPALMLADAVARILPGVLANEEAFTLESHYNGLLEYPQYTRPEEWNGMRVPEVLLSGHHANIERWRREQSLECTWRKRPDLLETAPLTEADRAYLEALGQNNERDTKAQTGE